MPSPLPGFPEHHLDAAPGTCWRDNISKHIATLNRKATHFNLLHSAESSSLLRDSDDRRGLGAPELTAAVADGWLPRVLVVQAAYLCLLEEGASLVTSAKAGKEGAHRWFKP